MDWVLVSGGAPSFVHIPLGVYYNNQYYPSNQCSTYLEELAKQLDCDNNKTHWRRRGLGFVDIINTDLKPILIHCNDQPEVFHSTVKLLVQLITPTEFLVFEDIPDQKNYSSFIISELTLHLYKAKETFLDFTATRVIIDYVRRLLKKQPLSFEETNCGNACLLLLRNLLFAKDRPGNSPENLQQNQFVCNLFAEAFDELILDMLASPHRDEWIAAIAQIITLLFKDRPVENIQNRLSTLIGPATSELSADDDESDTNLDDQIVDTFEEMTISSNSSSSSKRKIKRIEVEYLPIDDNISMLLERFVVEFMPKGFNILVGNLHHQLLRNEDVQLDKAQFFWLIAYFLGFVSILNLDIKCIKDVLNIDILCYLTWEAHREAEKEEWFQRTLEIKPRRLHRCVTAIREYLLVLEMNSNLGDSLEGSEEFRGFEDWTNRLRVHLPAMRDLRQLFLFLIRQYNPKFQDCQYFRDVITANHLLLLTLKRAHGSPTFGENFDFKEHLQQFCSKTILIRYGTALEDFKTNDTFFNESILTLLKYLNDDLGRTDLLCEPFIILPFRKIWEEKSNILDDWHDLIAYALHNFMSNYHSSHYDDLRSQFVTESGLWDQEISQGNKPIYQFDTQAEPVADDVSQTDLQLIIDQLRSLGFQKQLDWIQSSILTTCSAQLGFYAGKEFCNPIACLSLRKNISCPIVPWTEMEAFALCSDLFCSFLNRLGLLSYPLPGPEQNFQLPSPTTTPHPTTILTTTLYPPSTTTTLYPHIATTNPPPQTTTTSTTLYTPPQQQHQRQQHPPPPNNINNTPYPPPTTSNKSNSNNTPAQQLPATPTAFFPCIPREWSAKILYEIALMLGPIDPVHFNVSLLTKSEQLSNLGILFDHTTDGFLSQMWEPKEETGSSTSVPEVSSRVLKWIEQQSGIRVCSPGMDVDGSAILNERSAGLTDLNELFLKSISMEELPLDDTI